MNEQDAQVAELKNLLQETLNSLAPFCRDTSLPPNILARYQPGVIFREPTFCDASYKIAGFCAPHRYLCLDGGCQGRASHGVLSASWLH